MAANNSSHLIPGDWSCACHLTIGGNGSVVVIERRHGVTRTVPIPQSPASGLDEARRPALVGLDQHRSAILFDPVSKKISVQAELPMDALPAYAYIDASTQTYWMMNDGDKESGVDSISCNNQGAPVIVVDSTSDTPATPPTVVCAGRGHHVTVFVHGPKLQRRAYASNLIEGSITVIGNDPAAKDSYLNVLATINLCDPACEDGKRGLLPNKAFPHGMGYSSHTGKLYNLNNGYGTIAVIDPVDNVIERTYKMPLSSNLLLSPDGRFLIGKGVDRKADPNHLMGRISVMDAASGEMVASLDLKDVYPSVYRFNTAGTKLYVTTAATGKGTQKENAKLNSVLIFDTSALPTIRLLKEVTVGTADCGRRPLAFYDAASATKLVFIPNPTDGTLSILDGETDTVLETVSLYSQPIDELNFMYWRSQLHGA